MTGGRRAKPGPSFMIGGIRVAIAVNPSLDALVTLDELQAYLNQSSAALGDTRNEALQRVINAVSEAIKRHCSTRLIKRALVEHYDGSPVARVGLAEDRRVRIVLNAAPVDTAETFSVVENGVALEMCADGSDKTEGGDAPGYWLDPAAGVLYRNGFWARGKRIVRVSYTAGWGWQYKDAVARRVQVSEAFDHTDIPDDLREAALIVCKAHTDLGPTNWGVQVLPDGGVLRPPAWPLAARLMLDSYVRRTL